MSEPTNTGSDGGWMFLAFFTGPMGAWTTAFNRPLGIGLVALPLVLEGLSRGVKKVRDQE